MASYYYVLKTEISALADSYMSQVQTENSCEISCCCLFVIDDLTSLIQLLCTEISGRKH